MSKFLSIRPEQDPKAPGWRLRIERMDDGLAVISSEHVHPEQVENPDANFVEGADCILLMRDSAEWIRDTLSEMLRQWPIVGECTHCAGVGILGPPPHAIPCPKCRAL